MLSELTHPCSQMRRLQVSEPAVRVKCAATLDRRAAQKASGCACSRGLPSFSLVIVSGGILDPELKYGSTHEDNPVALFVFDLVCFSAHSNSTATFIDEHAIGGR